MGVDLQDGDVGRRVSADDPSLDPVFPGEVDEDLVGALDHVIVRDDVAVLVQHEARPERLRALLAEERVLADHVRRHLNDAGGGIAVHRCDRSSRLAAAEGCNGRALVVAAFAHDRRRASTVPDEGADPDGGSSAEERRDNEREKRPHANSL
jgi:hypothetical protein